jgi:hypothetical protein
MQPQLPERIHALLLYLGGAVFIRARRSQSFSSYLGRHHEAALGSWLLLAGVLAALVVAVALLSVVMVVARDLYEHWMLEPYLLDAVWKLFLAWGVVHLFCIAHALAGRDHPLPIVSRLGAQAWVRRTVGVAGWSVACLLLVGAALSAHAALLTRSDPAPGKVYLVYENNGVVPQWIFGLAMYRMALASREAYGPDQAVLLRISSDNIRRAFREGAVAVIASHGQEQGIIAEKEWFTPNDLEQGDVGRDLRYVYLSGCDSGAQSEAWERALRPAQVSTHNRLTAVVEHVWWMWFEAPGIIREVDRREERKAPLPHKESGAQ